MAGKITIREDVCKGCDLCVFICPKKIISIDSSKINARGYHPAKCDKMEECTACAMCAIMCPDSAIKVEKE